MTNKCLVLLFCALAALPAFSAQHVAIHPRPGFETGELGTVLRTERVTAVTVTGLATDYCVAATARDALREGFLVTIDRAGVRGIGPEGSERALTELEGSGAVITG